MLQYPVILEQDTGTVLVSFPDIPEAHTYGADAGDALTRAANALETALVLYMDFRRDIPIPSRPRKRANAVALPALIEAKVRLYQAMREEGIAKTDLARRLGWNAPQVDRLLDLAHASRLDQIEAAFQALKRTLSITISPAA
ncbi:MAG TPA: type II toxin-antitoxin system HicB family antitoxin [Bryobacteraceae bacterium]|jgi:antitoxin HicB|nr:type II toxin-antitoxin system HicB family antitoxin [Bryobacteraceae bacterium]